MYYIVYDLEFNQKDKNNHYDSTSVVSLPFEIIQIGAIKLNENFEIIDKFNTLVKPTLYTSIHPYIEELTKISNSDIDSAPNFLNVFENFKKFIGDDTSVLCVWGQADIKILRQNMDFHNIPLYFLPQKYIDIQLHASKYFKTPSGSRIGLRNAIELLNIPISNNFHNAFNDAIYTTEVFKQVYNSNFVIQEYNSTQTKKRPNKSKETIDFVGLIKQIEKMYGRAMTDEEKEIIKLSYFMGKTEQYKIKN